MLFAIDTETTGTALSDEAFIVTVHIQGEAEPRGWDFRIEGQRAEFLDFARRLFQPDNVAVAHNAQFDVFYLHKLVGDAVFAPVWEDTLVLAKLENEHRTSYDLDHMAWVHLRERKDNSLYEKMADLFGGKPTRNVQMKRIFEAPHDVVMPYALKDATLTLRLWEKLNGDMAKQGLEKIRDFERQVTQHLVRLKVEGVKVNPDTARRNIGVLEEAISEEVRKGDALGLNGININSPKQVHELFKFRQDRFGDWYVYDAPVDRWIRIPSTPKGAPALRGDVLSDMEDERAKWISNMRSLIKTRDTFLKTYVIEDSWQGRLHPTWNQVLSSGRISMTGPTLQNVPSRNKTAAKAVRQCFEPDDGQVWVEMDLSSHEVRVFAHLVGKFDDNLIREYRQNPDLDLHQYVADLTGLPRNPPKGGAPNAKQLNLSMIFCMGNGTVAETLGLPWEYATLDNGERYKKAGPEAMKIIEEYHRRVPGVAKLRDAAQAIVKRRGYIRTFMGRKLRIPKDKIYKTSAMLIQSTSADYNKIYLMHIDRLARERGGRLLANIHDSYSVSLPPEAVEDFVATVQNDLLHPTRWEPPRVPILIELNGTGDTWWQAYNGGDD